MENWSTNLKKKFQTKKLFTRDQNKKIFFLHLDVDLYSSYKICLEKLWNNVIKGGIVCFDEYSDPKWPGAKEAVDEFLKKKGLSVKREPVTNKGFVIKK